MQVYALNIRGDESSLSSPRSVSLLPAQIDAGVAVDAAVRPDLIPGAQTVLLPEPFGVGGVLAPQASYISASKGSPKDTGPPIQAAVT